MGKQSGLPGLDSYRRAAFLEQHQRAEAASKAAELRLQLSRQERRQQPRGRRRSSVSTASTREPTPEFNSTLQLEQSQPHAKDSIGGLFTGKAKRKAKPMNFNSLRK